MIRRMLQAHFDFAPDRIVIAELDGRCCTLHELDAEVDALAQRLRVAFGPCTGRVFGIAMRSSVPWVVAMLAVSRVDAVLLPVPIEFSDDQIGHLLGKASAVFVADAGTERRLAAVLPAKLRLDLGGTIPWPPIDPAAPAERVEPGLYGIIHTSGTTSRPKGVKIRNEAVGRLVNSVLQRVPTGPLRYLSIVPMSLLIEQVLGVLLPLLSCGTLVLMPAEVDEYGARSGHASDYLDLIARARPNFIYLPPKLLEEAQVLLASRSVVSLFGPEPPHVITGGARIAASVLEDLDARGVHVYEAYGLSENSSIVSMNHPGHRRIGSAGTFLDGIVPELVDGELLVETPTLCAGYYNADDTACDLTDGKLHTGDLAEIRDGYLYVTGRKKHVIILSTARNLSPEWVESVYKESPLIDDVIVIGEGREEPAAVVLSTHPEADVRHAMAALDPRLAEFARVRRVVLVADIPAFRRDYYTVTGRPRRPLIERDHSEVLYA